MTKEQIKRRLKILVGFYKRIGLKNRCFSILSNNCWGGAVYDRYHLPYQSPTIGLWLTAEDYLRFLGNLSFYLSQDMQQINWRESHCKELVQERKQRGKYSFDLDELIIGRLCDVDIVFLHYHSFDDAKRKWNYRKERINYDNLLVKFNDQNGFHKRLYDEFEKLPFKNKLFITAHKELCGKPDVVFLDEPEWDGSIKDDTILSKMPFDLKNILNRVCEDSYEFENIRGGVLPLQIEVCALAC